VRRLLGKLAQTGEFSDRETWQKWLAQLDRFPPRKLGPRPFELK
jgi:hypothetical protein